MTRWEKACLNQKLLSSMTTALREKKDLTEQQGLDFTFLILLKFRLRNASTECSWFACIINSLEPDMHWCVFCVGQEVLQSKLSESCTQNPPCWIPWAVCFLQATWVPLGIGWNIGEGAISRAGNPWHVFEALQSWTIDSASFAVTMTPGWIVTTKGTACFSPRGGRRASATTSRAQHPQWR